MTHPPLPEEDIDSLWDFADPALSEARFRRALETAQGAHEIELATQVARALGLQRRFNEGHHILDTLIQLLPQQPPRAGVRYRLERGRLYRSAGQPEQARPYFLEAWERAVAAGENALAIDAAHMLALVAPPEQQQAWNLRALELAEQSNDPRARRWLGSLYNNIGWTHHDQGRYAEALALFERAVEWRAAQGQPRELRIARWCVARALRSLGRVEQALAQQRDLLAQLQAENDSDGYIDEEIGECLLLLGRAQEARPHFARAHALLAADPWLAENEAGRLARLRELSEEQN
ncbi:MAG: tetratricopeptide repeat protein [Roseiflexaceae bacterium]